MLSRGSEARFRFSEPLLRSNSRGGRIRGARARRRPPAEAAVTSAWVGSCGNARTGRLDHRTPCAHRAGFDVGEEPRERGAGDVRAREAFVVVAVGHGCPSQPPLARDEGLARLALGLDRTEVGRDPLLDRLPPVDRAADRRRGRRALRRPRCGRRGWCRPTPSPHSMSRHLVVALRTGGRASRGAHLAGALRRGPSDRGRRRTKAVVPAQPPTSTRKPP